MVNSGLENEVSNLLAGEEISVTFKGKLFRFCRYGVWYFVMVEMPINVIDLSAWLYKNSEMLSHKEQVLSYHDKVYYCVLQKKIDIALIYENFIKYIGCN